jgi:anti-anti-sigma regulatory factor
MTAEKVPSVRIERSNGSVIVTFHVTTIDERNFAIIADELDEVARKPTPQSVIIDLTGVSHIDELGQTVLQSLRESVKEVGGKAVIAGDLDLITQPRNEKRPVRAIETRSLRRRHPQWTS